MFIPKKINTRELKLIPLSGFSEKYAVLVSYYGKNNTYTIITDFNLELNTAKKICFFYLKELQKLNKEYKLSYKRNYQIIQIKKLKEKEYFDLIPNSEYERFSIDKYK